MKIIYIFILTLIRFCLSCKEPGKISFLPPFNDAEDLQAKNGEDINIVCCHFDGADFLQWEDKDGNVISYKNSGGVFSLKDEKNRLILRIDNFDENKAGKYVCKSKKDSLTKFLNITFKKSSSLPIIYPIVKDFPKNKPIKVECPIKGEQVFKSWIYTEGKINSLVSKPGRGKNYEISEDQLTFIIINNENTESIKSLWCQFQYVVAKELQSGLYEFKWEFYDPIDVKIDLENTGPILEGHDVKMICSFNYVVTQVANFPSNIARPKFILKNFQSSGRMEMTIPKITKDLDGEYECKVTNFLPTGRMVEEIAKKRITVIIPPKFTKTDLMNVTVKINENAFLKCFIVGDNLTENNVFIERQFPDSSWIRLNSTNEGKYKIDFTTKLDKITLTLKINDVQWEDRGVYQCSASNVAGKATFTGILKVRKTPTLYTKSENIVMAIKPVEVDCSVSGFPISKDDKVQLRVLNQYSPFFIKEVKYVFNDMEELRIFYEVSYLKKLTEGVNYTLECFYYSDISKLRSEKLINLQIANRPDVPIVSIICSGSNGIVFQYEIQKKTQINKNVIKNELFYAPSYEFDSLDKKPSKIIPITEIEDMKKNLTYVLKNLMPSTNYSFKWDSYNIFQIASSVNLMSNTKNLSPPPKPTTLKFSTGNGVINVDVNWEDDCPYSGANEAIKDAIVKMKLLGSGDVEDKNRWEWAVTNFTLEIENKLLKFSITLEKPQLNYEIEVVLRSAQGVSKPIVAVYTAETVLAGSLFSCFPRCLSQSLSSNILLVYSALVIYLNLLRVML